MDKATTRRAVMTCAKGQTSFDLYTDIARANARAVMAAIHEEASRPNGRQPCKRVRNPVTLFGHGELDDVCRLFARSSPDKLA